MCKENCGKEAVVDYNGHGHMVCQLCNDKLEREFEEDYD